MYIGVHVELIAEYFHNKEERVCVCVNVCVCVSECECVCVFYFYHLILSHTLTLSLSYTLSDASMSYQLALPKYTRLYTP